MAAAAAAAGVLPARMLDCQMQRAAAAAAETEYYTAQEND